MLVDASRVFVEQSKPVKSDIANGEVEVAKVDILVVTDNAAADAEEMKERDMII